MRMGSKKIWRNSFSSRLFVCIFTTAFLVLMVGGIALFGASIHATSEMNQTLTKQNLTITQKNLEQLLSQVDTTVQMAFSQRDVLSATQKDFSEDAEAKQIIQHALTTTVASSDAITQINLCSDENGLLSTALKRQLPYASASDCLAYFATQPHNAIFNAQSWYFMQQDPRQPENRSVANVRIIKPPVGQAKELVLVVYLSEPEMSDVYSFLGDGSYIMAADGTIISAVDMALIGQKAEQEVLDAVVSRETELLYQEKDTFVYSVYLPTIASHLIVKAEAQALATTRHVMVVAAVSVILLGFLFSLIWAHFTSKTLTRPLKTLKGAMQEVRNGDLTVHCEPEHQDEIGYLCDSFNQMTDSLSRHVERIRQQSNEIKEGEIRLLQSQINPHLLYNTLDSAVGLMDRKEVAQSRQVLAVLSEYFKKALQKGSKIITVGAAISHVESYLKLQKLCRLKDYTLTVTGDLTLLEAQIMHMLMQPIVENSILHGFEGNFANGKINIDLQRQGDLLRIAVSDDGVGMDERELEALRASLDAPTSEKHGYALWNVVQRIKMYYGPQYGMQIDSEIGVYTTVTLMLPCQMDEKGTKAP